MRIVTASRLAAGLFLTLAASACAYGQAPTAAAAGSAPQQQAAPATQAMADYAGTYPLAPGADLAVRARDGALYVQLTGQPEFPLTHVDADSFTNAGLGLEVDFARGPDGSVTGLELRQAGQVLHGERQ